MKGLAKSVAKKWTLKMFKNAGKNQTDYLQSKN
jgi:hypothetical protein